MSDVHNIVAKVWKLCDILRDEGISYHQYVNELTYLLFLKMAEETGTEKTLLDGCRWSNLVELSGDPEAQYGRYLHMLDDLGTKGQGRIKQIFTNPTTFLCRPESLEKLVTEIGRLEWHAVGREGLGDVYEGLLQKNASDLKSGAGQYFTPRPLVDSIIRILQPHAGETIVDPAMGTGGFFVSANSAVADGKATFFGVEIVRDTHRLALMNASLHNIPGELILGDALARDGIVLPPVDLVVTNPPFGSKKGADRPLRTDLKYPTSNKQFAFLQLAYSCLKPGGRAGIIVPDNVLFEEGIGTKIRADLMEKCNLHTILRLPTGIFYAHGVKTNVLFFTRGKEDRGNTKQLWVYDLRTRMPAFGKRTPLTQKHFDEFEKAFGKKSDGTSKRTDQGENGRFRCFGREDVKKRGDNVDINWLKDDAGNDREETHEPESIAAMIRERLAIALEEMDALTELLGDSE
ncbi:MAG: hypothetical protein JWP89_3375 [Schlesneria sp.]|nr:hypothetical protein [Schlesneria sp.]